MCLHHICVTATVYPLWLSDPTIHTQKNALNYKMTDDKADRTKCSKLPQKAGDDHRLEHNEERREKKTRINEIRKHLPKWQWRCVCSMWPALRWTVWQLSAANALCDSKTNKIHAKMAERRMVWCLDFINKFIFAHELSTAINLAKCHKCVWFKLHRLWHERLPNRSNALVLPEIVQR